MGAQLSTKQAAQATERRAQQKTAKSATADQAVVETGKDAKLDGSKDNGSKAATATKLSVAVTTAALAAKQVETDAVEAAEKADRLATECNARNMYTAYKDAQLL